MQANVVHEQCYETVEFQSIEPRAACTCQPQEPIEEGGKAD